MLFERMTSRFRSGGDPGRVGVRQRPSGTEPRRRKRRRAGRQPRPRRQLGEAACRSRSDCAVGACSICGGGAPFISCYDPATESGPIKLRRRVSGPLFDPRRGVVQDPHGLPRRRVPQLQRRQRFRPMRCPQRSADRLSRDSLPGPLRTGDDEGRVRGAARLSPVFVDDRACGCAALGCCSASRAVPMEAAPYANHLAILCDAVAPHCEGPYVISYTASCYEGCVQSTDCMAN